MMESLGLIDANNEDRLDAGDVVGTAADLVVDPVNWLGAGLIGKMLRAKAGGAAARGVDPLTKSLLAPRAIREPVAEIAEAVAPKAPAADVIPELANYSAAKEGAGIETLTQLEEEWARRSIQGNKDYRAAFKEGVRKGGGFIPAEEGERIAAEAQLKAAASDAEMAALKTKIRASDKANEADVRRIFGDELADQGAFPSPLQEMAAAKADAQVASSAIKPTKRMIKAQQEAERKAQIAATELAEIEAFRAKTAASAKQPKQGFDEPITPEGKARKAAREAKAAEKPVPTKEMRDAAIAETVAQFGDSPYISVTPSAAKKAKERVATQLDMFGAYDRTKQLRQMEEIFGKELMDQGAYPDLESLAKSAEALEKPIAVKPEAPVVSPVKGPTKKEQESLQRVKEAKGQAEVSAMHSQLNDRAGQDLSNKPRSKMTPAEIDKVDRIVAENLEKNISMHLRTVQGLAADEAKQIASGAMKKAKAKGWQKDVDKLTEDLAQIKAENAAKYGETYWGHAAAAPAKPKATKGWTQQEADEMNERLAKERADRAKRGKAAAPAKAAAPVAAKAEDLEWDERSHSWVYPKAKPDEAAYLDRVKEKAAAMTKEKIVRKELERIFGVELTEGRHLPMPDDFQ